MEVLDYKICEKTSGTLQMAATHIFERGHTQISFMKSVENGHKKTFLETIMPKRKTMTVKITQLKKKNPWAPNIGRNTRKELKTYTKILLLHLART